MTVGPRAKLLVLLGLFALPIVASVVAYRYFRPQPTANYGELLLPPAPAPRIAFSRPGGGTFGLEELRDRWVMVASDSGACAAACIAKLTTMRQVRLALGRNAPRVARVFVVDDTSAPASVLAEAFPGMEVAITPRGMEVPPGVANDRAHVYLVDPRGDVMMRWPADADGKRMLNDLNRLLKASQIG